MCVWVGEIVSYPGHSFLLSCSLDMRATLRGKGPSLVYTFNNPKMEVERLELSQCSKA